MAANSKDPEMQTYISSLMSRIQELEYEVGDLRDRLKEREFQTASSKKGNNKAIDEIGCNDFHDSDRV